MNAMLLDLAVKSVIVAAAGLTAVALLRRSSAATRHYVLTLTMAGLLLLPVVSFLAPHWAVPFVRLEVPPATSRQVSIDAGLALPASVPSWAPSATTAPSSSGLPLTLLLWSAVAGVCLLKIGVRLARLRGMERNLDMSDDAGLQAVVVEQCRHAGRHVLLLEGSVNEPPMTWGHFRPVMLLPRDAGSWQPLRIQSVVLHELAHVARGDWLSSVVAQIAAGLYWFNPLAWVISARMAAESEIAADDRVLGLGFSATDYATSLLAVLQDIRRSRSAANAALAMARPGSLDGRVRAILEARRCRRPVRGMALFVSLAIAAAMVAAIGAAGPKIVHAAPQAIGATSVGKPTIDAPVIVPGEIEVDTPATSTLIGSDSESTAEARVVASAPRPLSNAARHGKGSADGRRSAVIAKKATSKPLVPAHVGTAGIADRRAVAAHSSAAKTGGDTKVVDEEDINAVVSSALKEGAESFSEGLKEAQVQIAKSFDEAKRGLDKPGLSKAERDAAKRSIDAGRKIANVTLKNIGPILKSSFSAAAHSKDGSPKAGSPKAAAHKGAAKTDADPPDGSDLDH